MNRARLVLLLALAAMLIAAASASARVVIGAKAFAPYGEGWGTTRPHALFNGGDPSGSVSHIRWHHWGGRKARGWGKNPIFRPRGGYYRRAVRIQLHATRLRRCRAHGPRAYTRLWVREPKRPGGPLGRWFLWSGQRSLCRWAS